MWTWLPAMQLALPGAGFTVFNIWDVTYEWWLAYIDFTKRIIERKG